MSTERKNLTSHTAGIGGWSEERRVCDDLKIIVLKGNKIVTELLSTLIKKILSAHRYGVTLAKLAKAVEIGTGRRGLTSVETRWCLTWFLIHGMSEEELDRSPDPIGFERVDTPKVHINLTGYGADCNGVTCCFSP